MSKKKDKKEKVLTEDLKEEEIEDDKAPKKSKKKVRVCITILIVVVILAGLLYLAWTGGKEEPKVKKEVNVVDNLEEYGYTLSDNDTELFKEEFKKLKEILNSEEVDYEEYSKQVAKLFTIDVYTMSNKINIYDIGGAEYFYSEKRTMFEQKLIDTLYSSIEDNTYGDREQELPEVKSITVDSIEKTTYEMKKVVDEKEITTKVDGYKVKISWDYVKDMGYDKEAEVIIVPDGNIRYSVVEFQTKLDKK